MTTDPRLDGAVLTPADVARPRNAPPFDERDLQENVDHGERSLRKIPTRYQDAVADNTQVGDWVRALVGGAASRPSMTPYVNHGPSLLLIGGTGSGKTFQAFGAMRALAMSGARVNWLSITAADLYAKLRPRARVDTEEVFSDYLNVSVLVIDDLGAAKGSEWNEEINYRLINHRYEYEYPTLITSNVPPKDLASALGERVASRLVEMADRVVIKGADRRLSPKAGAA